MKNVMIRYTLNDDTNIDDVKTAARGFIEGLREHSSAILYTSYQLSDAEIRLVEARLPEIKQALQSAGYIKAPKKKK